MDGKKTYIGAAAALFAMILNMLAGEDVIKADEITNLVAGVVGISGAAYAMYGRWDAARRHQLDIEALTKYE